MSWGCVPCHAMSCWVLPARLGAATKTVQSESNHSDTVKSALSEKCKWRMIRKELSRQERNIWGNWSKTAIVEVTIGHGFCTESSAIKVALTIFFLIWLGQKLPLHLSAFYHEFPCLHSSLPLSSLAHSSCASPLFFPRRFAYVKIRLSSVHFE